MSVALTAKYPTPGLEALPEGRWTVCGDLADVAGTTPQPLGNHITTSFARTDPSDHRDPSEMLRDEKFGFVNDRADPTRRLTSNDLAGLVATE